MEKLVCNIKHDDESDPFNPMIDGFLLQHFPFAIKLGELEQLDQITEAIIATKSVRYGPRPRAEDEVCLRQIIMQAIRRKAPIPFLAPWGSEKPDRSKIDVAEFMAMKTLLALRDRVRDFYEPGIIVNIRSEDVSAPFLFHDRKEEAREDAAIYVKSFGNLIKILGMDSFIKLVPESTLTTEFEYNQTAEWVLPLMRQALTTGNVPEQLKKLDKPWVNPSPATIEYYYKLYANLYAKEKFEENQLARMSRYFAEVVARDILKIRGDDPSWEGRFVDLYFGQTIPGYPTRPNRIHYRTMPSTITNMHIAPWRAKGYMRINEREVSASLTSFREPQEYNRRCVTLQSKDLEQEVQCDYVLSDFTPVPLDN